MIYRSFFFCYRPHHDKFYFSMTLLFHVPEGENSTVTSSKGLSIMTALWALYIVWALKIWNLNLFSRWMYVLSFTGGSNAGGGRINTPPMEAAMPEVEEKTNLLVNRLEN